MCVFQSKRLLLACGLVVAALSGGSPQLLAAAPGQDGDSVQRPVSAAGLDLSNAKDRAVLNHRVAVAAYKVCQQVMNGDASGYPLYAECMERAKADARHQVEALVAAADKKGALVASARPQ
jgi:UrcA family protein